MSATILAVIKDFRHLEIYVLINLFMIMSETTSALFQIAE